MSKTRPSDSPYGPLYGFAIKKARRHPPIEVDPREWVRRTQTGGYRRRIKHVVQLANAYLLLCRGRTGGVTGHQRDACHYFADVSTYDSERRSRGPRTESAAPATDVLKASLHY